MYNMDTQHQPILTTVRIRTRHLLSQTARQCTDWAAIKASLETLHLESSFATAADVNHTRQSASEQNKEGSVCGYDLPSYVDVASRGPAFAHKSNTTTETQTTQTVGSYLLSQT
ncbi:hypothetical protein EVAR_65882_1 [Eumeta japonica]|uniref:Uncharacterized protein n=1 Tax=Eumeta variegata TaxID=151549 RepID=A0A4C1ZDH4_EUMVA|nr:hypothetical protein EVAR_65882_1 [Eumeta japonica]